MFDNRKEFVIIDSMDLIQYLKRAMSQIAANHDDIAFFTEFHIREILGQITEWMIFKYDDYRRDPQTHMFVLDAQRLGDAFDEMTPEDEVHLRNAINAVCDILLRMLLSLGAQEDDGGDLGIPYGFHELRGNDIVLRYLGD